MKSKLVIARAALVHNGQVAGSDVEFWYVYTVLLLTRYKIHLMIYFLIYRNLLEFITFV